MIIKEESLPKEKLNLVSLTSGGPQGKSGMTEAHIRLQKILKKERTENLDEDSII